MHMITTSEMRPETAAFDILCLAHRLEMSSRHEARAGTIRWVYGATAIDLLSFERSRQRNHDAAAEVFLGLAKAANAERLAIVESERRARARRSGLALAAALAMATLAFGGVLTAWTDVAAAPGLRSEDDVLSIAAADPADEAMPLLPVVSMRPVVPKIIELDQLVIDEAVPIPDDELYDFGGPLGRADDEVRPSDLEASSIERSAPVARRSSRSRPFVAARPVEPVPVAEGLTVESMAPSIQASMTFGRDELEPELPRTLTRGQISIGLRSVARMVRNCARGEPDRTIRVDLSIDGTTGHVTTARVRGYHEHTTAGTCVTRALQRARFPMFSDAEISLHAYPLVLR